MKVHPFLLSQWNIVLSELNQTHIICLLWMEFSGPCSPGHSRWSNGPFGPKIPWNNETWLSLMELDFWKNEIRATHILIIHLSDSYRACPSFCQTAVEWGRALVSLPWEQSPNPALSVDRQMSACSCRMFDHPKPSLWRTLISFSLLSVMDCITPAVHYMHCVKSQNKVLFLGL